MILKIPQYRYCGIQNRGIAQLVEHRSPKPSVVSSNLTAPAIEDEPSERAVFLLQNKHLETK